ncbi:MAG: RIP metalloprotease RseP [Spirochaetaceae bacterium]|jgi:regulator of sigma E protease|nr:RIP metalloprotease RseP [Spirochaetaceae bacterium]
MLIVKFLLGLAGLGIVVFVHELGHFIAARLSGIGVDAFSIGWGPPVLHKKIGDVDYRLGAFPAGGYCKMSGESDFNQFWEDRQKGVLPPPASFFGVRPSRRIVTAAAGPVFNILFAVLVFSVLSTFSSEVNTLGNRIVLAKDITGESYPADRAGLMSGDYITAINGEKTGNYHDIQELIAVNAKKPLQFSVMRNGAEASFAIEPEMDTESGAGRIGIYFWTDPVIFDIDPSGAAARAGLQAGDKIVRWDGEDFPYSAAVYKIYNNKEIPPSIPVVYERAGKRYETVMEPLPSDEGKYGITWPYIVYTQPGYGFFGAIAEGAKKAYRTFTRSVHGLTLLFRGLDLTKAISGPVRISYIAGDIAAANFTQNPFLALRGFFEFLALISIALALMNLLPLPILDGGAIVLYLLEMGTRKPVHPRVFNALQMAGVALIASLMLLAIYGDIMFFIKR